MYKSVKISYFNFRQAEFCHTFQPLYISVYQCPAHLIMDYKSSRNSTFGRLSTEKLQYMPEKQVYKKIFGHCKNIGIINKFEINKITMWNL